MTASNLAERIGPLETTVRTVAPAEQRSHRPVRVVAIILVAGVLLTGLSTWAAHRVDRNAEERLLEVQTRQAAAVLSTAVLLIEQPLSTALSMQSAIGGSGDPAVFTRYMSTVVGADRLFISASLWSIGDTGPTQIATVGEAPGLDPQGAPLQEMLDRALGGESAVVQRIVVGDQIRIAWAVADPATGFIVYAERPIPADRRAPVDRDSAYADLDYAIYLGEQTSMATLSTTDVDPATLPLDGLTYQTTVPFGDTVLTMVTTPSRHLGASLTQHLPWIILLGGLLLTVLAAIVANQLASGRRAAEGNAETITDLYERVDSLFGEQRALFVRLQRALLPHSIPRIPGFETAAEYMAGTRGLDIGGDWYSVIDTSDEEFAFVVGDVSGRGVDAVAVMAQARFTLRAYLVDGESPRSALEKASRQFDIADDGHMTTVIVGVGNWRTGQVTMVCAGHPLPLLIADGEPEYVAMPVGPPLGTGATSYTEQTITMPTGSSLLLYTDGLIERRTEDIDTGMRRLAATAAPLAREPLGTVVSTLLRNLRGDDASDDIAILALRRVTR